MQEFPLLEGIEVDRRLSLAIGSVDRLARRKKLKHVVLPNGSIRFSWPDVVEALKTVDPSPIKRSEAEHG